MGDVDHTRGHDEATGADAESETGGVFGNLPTSRPAVRSPRRDATTRSASASKREPPRPSRASAARRPRPGELAEPVAPDTDRGGVEDMAWAGIAVAAEAATLGLRLFGRAVGAVRDATGRD